MADVLSWTAAAYLAALVLWLVSHILVGDATWWLFVINALAVYLFLPLPGVLLFAVFARRRWLLRGAVAALVVWAYFWGALYLPGGASDAEGPSLTLMSFNMLVFNHDSEAIVGAIRDSDADVVLLLELSAENAAAIGSRLAGEYPYRTLDGGNATGAGVLSRLPYRAVRAPELQDTRWIGAPQVIDLELEGRTVTVVRFHAVGLVRNFAVRERQAQKLADFARNSPNPIIVAGDLNATPMNGAYDILTDVLTDAWREKGTGLGHSFPGASKATSPGSSRPSMFGISVPKWLVRIDYIFHSPDWQTASIRSGPEAGSDHRGVIARLVLKP